MAIKFLLSADDDLIWDIDDHSEPLTEQQAKLVAPKNVANGRSDGEASLAAAHQSAKPIRLLLYCFVLRRFRCFS